MFEISDISVNYHSLTKDEKCIFVTDSWKPIISYQVISDRRDTSLRSACIKMNQWEKNTDEQREIVYEGEPLHISLQQPWGFLICIWMETGFMRTILLRDLQIMSIIFSTITIHLILWKESMNFGRL